MRHLPLGQAFPGSESIEPAWDGSAGQDRFGCDWPERRVGDHAAHWDNDAVFGAAGALLFAQCDDRALAVRTNGMDRMGTGHGLASSR